MSDIGPYWKAYLRISGCLLLATGCAKLVSVAVGAPILRIEDPMLGIKTATLLMLLGPGECALGLYCWLDRTGYRAAGLVAATSVTFMAYRVCLLLMGAPHYCPCLGNAGDWIGWSPQTVAMVLWSLLLWLAAGSFWLVFKDILGCRASRSGPAAERVDSATVDTAHDPAVDRGRP
jgi:hypothetical protein